MKNDEEECSRYHPHKSIDVYCTHAVLISSPHQGTTPMTPAGTASFALTSGIPIK